MKQPTMILTPTPNVSRRNGKVKFIILHHTAGHYPGDLNWLTNPASHVSADFYVRQDGTIHKLNPQLRTMKTWHSGASIYQGIQDGLRTLNKYSVGIEMEHKEGDRWPEVQVKAVGELCAWLEELFGLDLDTNPITSHAAVALPKRRKNDPERFPWGEFSRAVRAAGM